MTNLTNSDFYCSLFKKLKEIFDLNYLDYYFAKLMLENEEKDNYGAFFFLMYLSMKTRNGDVCIDIKKDHGIVEFLNELNFSYEDFENEISGLKASGSPNDNTPIIIEEKRAYLNKYYNYEKFLYFWIKNRSAIKDYDPVKMHKLNNEILPKYFKKNEADEIDWQKFAVIISCISSFCAVSGGPGTGKTTAIAKIIACLQETSAPDFLKIKLCAPTGKAASRLIEALNSVSEKLNLKQEIKASIPETAYTIHRLLEYSPSIGKFKYNFENKLDADLVVVDEASMVDIRLMFCLCSALKSSCRLILLGDRFQLASVSPGSVFGDICRRGESFSYSKELIQNLEEFFHIKRLDYTEESFFLDSVAELKKSYRFDDKSGIGKLANAIKSGDPEKGYSLLNSGLKDLLFINTSEVRDFEKIIIEYADHYFSKILNSSDPEQAFQNFLNFIILSPVKKGHFGVEKINEIVEKRLLKYSGLNEDSFWYHGKPVMIIENDYKNGLFNGDIGICLNDTENNNRLRVFFQSDNGGFKKIHPVRLQNPEPVFSMTVHKSQGSEFENVFVVFPENYFDLLTAELMYTAITRAKKKVILSCSKEIFFSCVKKRVERSSGLFEKLWNK